MAKILLFISSTILSLKEIGFSEDNFSICFLQVYLSLFRVLCFGIYILLLLLRLLGVYILSLGLPRVYSLSLLLCLPGDYVLFLLVFFIRGLPGLNLVVYLAINRGILATVVLTDLFGLAIELFSGSFFLCLFECRV